MKLMISADIEGTCGICSWDETTGSHPEYAYFQAQMTKEVAGVCEAALESNRVKELLIKDAHDNARNLIPSMLPEEVEIIRGWEGVPGGMMSGIREDISAVAMTGYHSAAYTAGNPLAHTSNRQNQFVKLNGQIASEFLINAYLAAYYKVPVILLSGDRALCESAKELIPAIETVAVSEGCGTASKSVHPSKAVRLLKEGMKRALQKDPAQCLIKLPEHFLAEIEFKELGKAQRGANYPGAVRTGTRSVSYEAADYYEIVRFFYFVL